MTPDALSYKELQALLERTSRALTAWVQVGLNDAQRAEVLTQVVGILTPWADYVESRNNPPGHEVPDEVLRPLIADLTEAIGRLTRRLD